MPVSSQLQIFYAIGCYKLIHDHLAGPPVVACQAVFPRGIDQVTVRKPGPPSPLIEAGTFLYRGRPSDMVERELSVIEQLDSQACHAGITFPMRRYSSAHPGVFVVGGLGRKSSAASHINNNKK
jgi:hypothetical protein